MTTEQRIEPRSLGEISLEPGTFEHDVVVSQRYQEFSSELLRLALLSIGAVGFLAEHFHLENWSKPSKAAITASIVLMGLSAASALTHRYIGPDSLAFHLAFVRLRKRGNPTDLEKANKQKRERNRLFRHAGAVLLGSTLFLALGFVSLVAGFVLHLWQY